MTQSNPDWQLTQLHAGEEPYDDERLVPTPAQWIWLWNRATPAERLQRAQRAIEEAEQARHLYFLRVGGGGPAEPGTPLCTAYWDTPNHGRVHCWRGADHEEGGFHVGETVDRYRYQWMDDAEGAVPHGTPAHAAAGSGAAREAVRQMDADPHGLKAVMVVKPYTERGVQKWVFRCWGSDACDGWLSLDHASENSAGAARDRHLVEAHPELVATALRERRERVGLLAAVLGEVLAAFRSVVDDGTRTLVGYVSAPIHPDDMDRWCAALNSPKESTP